MHGTLILYHCIRYTSHAVITNDTVGDFESWGYMVYGIWYMVYGIWYMVYGICEI